MQDLRTVFSVEKGLSFGLAEMHHLLQTPSIFFGEVVIAFSAGLVNEKESRFE